MKILADIHTHTSVSHHAYSTLGENLAAAKAKGLELICMTNHGPTLPDSAHIWHFENMRVLPGEVDGVKLLHGIEANIVGPGGELDISPELQKMMDVVIASLHRPTYYPETLEEHTEMFIKVTENPYVTVLGHPDRCDTPVDFEAVAEAAKKAHKCIEINNHSFHIRNANPERSRKLIAACKKVGVYVTVNSDAHADFQVGEVGAALEALEKADFPESLIMNLNAERFLQYLKELHEEAGIC